MADVLMSEGKGIGSFMRQETTRKEVFSRP